MAAAESCFSHQVDLTSRADPTSVILLESLAVSC